MKQLVLALAPEAQASLEATVPGRNQELLGALRALVTGKVPEPWIYVWGEPGAGRSHWLRAALRDAEALGRRVATWVDRADVPAGSLVAVDDVDRLSPEAQVELFHLLHRAREGEFQCLVAGNAPPARLSVRDDVRTRLGAALVYRVHPLDDADKALLLQRLAAGRGFDLPPEVARYLLTRGDRDLSALVRSLDLLDRASLERQRPLTVPLLREAFRECGAGSPAAAPDDSGPRALVTDR